MKFSHRAWKWLVIKRFPSVSKTEKEESEHILCLQLIWSYGLIADAFQTDFPDWKSFIIFLWRAIQTLWKMFCSTMDCKKQKAEIWKPAREGLQKFTVIQMSNIRVFSYILNIYICTFIYTYAYLHIPTCAYFQTSYFKSSPASPPSAFERSHVKAGGQPRFPGPGARCSFEGKLQPGSHDVGDDSEEEISVWEYIFPGHRTITAHCQMVLSGSITWIGHWVFILPPHKNYFVICHLFPRALECPLNILCGWHHFAQNKHAPWACGLYFF